MLSGSGKCKLESVGSFTGTPYSFIYNSSDEVFTPFLRPQSH